MSSIKRDEVTVIGDLKIFLHGPDGSLKEYREKHNLITTVGKQLIASRLRGDTDAVLSHMGIGTSAAAVAAGQTTLSAELAARTAFSGVVGVDNVNTYTAVFGAGVGTGSLKEAALFNAASGGTMFNRATFPEVNKDPGDTLTINWSITFA